MAEKQTNRKALIAFAICVGLAHVLPLYTPPILIFYNDALAILGVIIAVALVGDDKKLQVQVPWLAALPLALAALIVMQMVVGMLRLNSDAIYPLVYFLVASITVLLGASIAAQKQGSIHLCTVLTYTYLLVGLVSVVIALLQFFGMEVYVPFVLQLERGAGNAPRPYANMGQPNQLALLLCLSTASIWWLYQAGRLRNAIAVGLTLIMLTGLALTQSRTGWLIVLAFASLLFFWQRKTEFRKVSGLLIGSLILIYVLMVVMLPVLASFLINLSAPSVVERVAVGAASERLVFFELAWKISLAHPWFGAGWGEFVSQQQVFAVNFVSSLHATHAHNIILNFAAELGWPVTIVIVGMMSYWFFTCCLRRKISPEVGFATFFLGAVIIHSMVEFPLWYAYVLLPFALLAGMIHHEQIGSSTFSVSRTYSAGLFFLMGVLFVGIAIDYRGVVVAYRHQALEAAGWQKVGNAVASRPDFTISAQHYDHVQFSKIVAHEKMAPEQIIFMERVAQRFGYLPNLRRMAFVYTLNNQPDKAVEKLLVIRTLFGCAYVELYKEWGAPIKEEAEKFMKVFVQLPAPTSNICQ